MATQPVTPNPATPPISGLPPGAVVRPMVTSGAPLPQGAVIKPFAAPQVSSPTAAAPTTPAAQTSALGAAAFGGDESRGIPANPMSEIPIGMVKGGMHTVAGVLNLLARGRERGLRDEQQRMAQEGVPGAGRSLTSLIDPQQQKDAVTQHTRAAADWLNAHAEDHGAWQHLGDFGESALELMTPEALGALAKGEEAVKTGTALARTGEAAAGLSKTGELAIATKAEKLAEAAKAAKVLDQYPRIKSLVMIGLAAAARGGAETGAQTYVKTGGDTNAAISAAETGAAAGGVLAPAGELAGVAARKLTPATRTVEGIEIPEPKPRVPTAAEVAGGKAYTETSRAVVRPHLEAMGARPEQVDAILNHVHDFTGASDALTKVNDKAYDALDAATGNKFRALNDEVSRAQKQAWDGGPEAEAAYKNKQAEMEDLLNKSGVPKDLLSNVKASWRQSYILSDMGKKLDQAMDGVPGASQASQTYRGFNGNRLQNGLRGMVNQYGRETVENALGGPERLENLQAIADATKTNTGRKAFNFGVRRVVEWLPAYLGYKAGEQYGGFAGGVAGASAAEALAVATQRVMRAVAANPKIGQNLLFAIQSGAKPENYAPFVGALIQQDETAKSNGAKKMEAGQ